MRHPPAKPTLEDLLLLFRREIKDACERDHLPYDLSFSQIEVIRFIGPHGAQTMKHIAQFLKITPPSTTTIISEMEQRGIVRRHHDPKDRRTVYVSLTDKTKRVYTKMQERKKQIIDTMLNRLSDTEKKSLERIITRIINN